MSTKRTLRSQVSLDMRECDAQRLLTFLECEKCHELASDAVETLCCRALLCADCLEQRGRRCPRCEAACSHTPSHLARRLIGMQPWSCSECDKNTTRSERADHALVCSQRVRQCPAGGCNFSGLPEAFLDHLLDEHKEELLSRIERLFRPVRQRVSRRNSSESSEADSSSEFGIPVHDSMEMYRHAFRFGDVSSSREFSRIQMRVTGKNYCMGLLNGSPCGCCDGMCGPDNGCNCVDCMRRDLVTFNINRPLTLVNREGVVAKISRETGMFYCGRAVMAHDPETDGCCGPNNGNNCHACHKLDQQLRGRYAAIAEQWDLEELGVREALDMSAALEDDDASMPVGIDVID